MFSAVGDQVNGELPDLSDPELHKAAITIQAAFKFYKHSKRRKEREEAEAQQVCWKIKQKNSLYVGNQRKRTSKRTICMLEIKGKEQMK